MSIKEMIQHYAELGDSVAIIQQQIDELQRQKKEAEEAQAQIKHDLKHEMMGAGKKRAIIAGWKLNLSESTSTVIEEVDLLPEEYFKIVQTPDLMKVKDAIKQGENVPGAILKKSTNLSLKRVA